MGTVLGHEDGVGSSMVQKKLVLFHLRLQMQAFRSAPHFLWDRAAGKGCRQ